MHSPLNSYVYIYWILNFKYILLLNIQRKQRGVNVGAVEEMGVVCLGVTEGAHR